MQVRRIDQVIITASPGDAITSMTLALRDQLRSFVASDVFALTVLPAMKGEVFQLSRLGPDIPGSALVYHSSFGEPEVTHLLRNRRQQLALIFHNVTPPSYFEAHSARFATGLLWGMHELQQLKERWSLVIADSEFNASVLRNHGYSEIHVAAAGVQAGRLGKFKTDYRLRRKLRTRFPDGFVISVGQQLPHKRIEHALIALHLLREVHGIRLGLVVVGPERIPHYSAALRALSQRLHIDEQVLFTGAVDDQALATYVRTSLCFVLTSDHEGYGIPPLEAMADLVPVVARGVGAIPSTVGPGGIVLPASSGPCHFAEAIAMVASHPLVRDQMVLAGLRRVENLEAEDRTSEIADLLLAAFR